MRDTVSDDIKKKRSYAVFGPIAFEGHGGPIALSFFESVLL